MQKAELQRLRIWLGAGAVFFGAPLLFRLASGKNEKAIKLLALVWLAAEVFFLYFNVAV